MPVKRSHGGSRILAVLEAIAGHQPIGVSALARQLGEDKSAVQRALMTLADEGWIRASRGTPVRWEVTARILAVANAAQGSSDLRLRARPLLEQLRDDTRETVLLVVPDLQNFVIADVAESRQVLRLVPRTGDIVSARDTASGRAMLPYMDAASRLALLGGEPDAALLGIFEATRKQGYAVSDGEINAAATNIASPVFELDGSTVGAIVIIAPKERLTPAHHKAVGKLVVRAAQELSRGTPAGKDRGS